MLDAYFALFFWLLIYFLTYSMMQSPSWVANWFATSHKFPTFHGTRRFITALTTVRHLSLSRTSPIQSTYPCLTAWRSILILSTHLRLGLPSGLFHSGFSTETLYSSLSSPIRWTCPSHLSLLDFSTRTIFGEVYKSFSSSLCSLLQFPFSSALLGPNILLNTLFSNTLSFTSSRWYKTSKISNYFLYRMDITHNVKRFYLHFPVFTVKKERTIT